VRRAAQHILWLGSAGCTLLVSTADLTSPPDASSDAASPLDATSDVSNAADVITNPGETGTDAPVIDPDLVGLWHFDETAGITGSDASGNGHAATLANGASFSTEGKKGGCVRLTADGSIALDSLEGSAFPRSGTLSLFFAYDFAEDDAFQRSILDSYDPTRSHLFVRRPNGVAPRVFQVALQPAMASYSFVSEFEVSRNVWVHVVLTWDEATKVGAAYIDGKIETYPYQMPFVPTQQRLKLGDSFNGRIDEVALYKRALTAAEVKTLL